MLDYTRLGSPRHSYCRLTLSIQTPDLLGLKDRHSDTRVLTTALEASRPALQIAVGASSRDKPRLSFTRLTIDI